jgi:uncharacterized coiled-coil protein SlyX
MGYDQISYVDLLKQFKIKQLAEKLKKRQEEAKETTDKVENPPLADPGS